MSITLRAITALMRGSSRLSFAAMTIKELDARAAKNVDLSMLML